METWKFAIITAMVLVVWRLFKGSKFSTESLQSKQQQKQQELNNQQAQELDNLSPWTVESNTTGDLEDTVFSNFLNLVNNQGVKRSNVEFPAGHRDHLAVFMLRSGDMIAFKYSDVNLNRCSQSCPSNHLGVQVRRKFPAQV